MFGLNTNYLTLQKTTFRFWEVVFLNVGVVYAGKMAIDGIHLLNGENSVEKAIRAKRQYDRDKDSKPGDKNNINAYKPVGVGSSHKTIIQSNKTIIQSNTTIKMGSEVEMKEQR